MTQWIGRSAALERLGVRAQTLYAYVSRGRIGMMPDPQDPRRSLYLRADIDRLAARRRRGRKADAIAASVMAWGEPSIPTRVSTIERGELAYRGENAVALSADRTLEEVAALLWDQAEPVSLAAKDGADGNPCSPLVALAGLADRSMASLGRSSASLSTDGAAAIALLATSFGISAGAGPLHERMAAAWAADARQADLLRRALVLMAEHEFNASTFAVRVAASTGASVPACLLAGLATLSGPHHGGAAAALTMLVRQVEQSGAGEALQIWLAADHDLPGFGHPLYPQGDARAEALLAWVEVDPPMAALAEAVRAATDLLPNIDFALCALTRAGALPADTPFKLFALGRSVGWVAHVLEQVAAGTLIRPRGRHLG